jgi:hypothetical protein
MRKITTFCFALLTLCFVHGAFAQEAAKAADTAKAPEAAAHYYHLDFVVQEVGTDGKPVNSRSYTSIVSTGTHDSVSIRADSRIPIVTSSFQFGDGKENRQYQWQNIGVHIDAGQAHEIGRQLALNLVADISSMADSTDETSHQPVTRQNKWQASVLIPIGKPTVVFTSDTLDSKGSMQLVVTATSLQ